MSTCQHEIVHIRPMGAGSGSRPPKQQYVPTTCKRQGMQRQADDAAAPCPLIHHVWGLLGQGGGRQSSHWLPAVARPHLTSPWDDIVVAVCRGPVLCKRQRGQPMVLPARPLLRVAVPPLGRLSRGVGGAPSGQLLPQRALPGLPCLGGSGVAPLRQGRQPALQQHRR